MQPPCRECARPFRRLPRAVTQAPQTIKKKKKKKWGGGGYGEAGGPRANSGPSACSPCLGILSADPQPFLQSPPNVSCSDADLCSHALSCLGILSPKEIHGLASLLFLRSSHSRFAAIARLCTWAMLGCSDSHTLGPGVRCISTSMDCSR